jgi:hypothetical protein
MAAYWVVCLADCLADLMADTWAEHLVVQRVGKTAVQWGEKMVE